jgi:DNA-binding NarL/FixJ family response regulator
MNFEITIAALALGATGTIASLLIYRRLRAQRSLLEFVEQQVADLQETLGKNKELLDTNAQRVTEQSRRIAWLETRIRTPKLAAEVVPEEVGVAEPVKLNMTERRHRVVKLAARGQNVEGIAATLGMLPGEVELIINLNQAAQVAK